MPSATTSTPSPCPPSWRPGRAARSSGCSRLADRPSSARAEVRRALAEDHASRDVTTRLLGAAADDLAQARFEAEGRFIVAGVPVLATVFQELDPTAEVQAVVAEGFRVAERATIATVRAPARALLAGERVALNFL